jgi:hypothetical protein
MKPRVARWSSLFLAAAAGTVFLILTGRMTLPRDVALLTTSSASLVPAVLVGAALLLPGRWRGSSVLAITIIWFSCALAERWQTVLTGDTTMAGMLPFSDAENYMQESSRLIEGQDLTSWGARRPLANVALAGFLGLTDDNLQLTYACINLALAVALGLACLELRHPFGIGATSLFSWLVFLFYRRYVGVYTSECVGLLWGVAGLWLILVGLRRRQLAIALCGLAALSVGLNIRAGALFVLPLLWIWLVYEFRVPGLRWAVVGAAAGVAMLSGFIASGLVQRTVGLSDGALFSNYSWTLYGLIFNGNWITVFQQHPEVNAMTERARSIYIYHLIGEALRENPWLLVRGLVQAWKEFFTQPHSGLGPYDFIMNLRAETFVYWLALVGVTATSWLAFRHSAGRLLAFASIGIAASVALAPTHDAIYMRVYAVTIPLIALVPGASFACLERGLLVRLGWPLNPAAETEPLPKLWGWGAGFLLLTLVFGLLLHVAAPRAPLARLVDERTLIWMRRTGTYVKMVGDSAPATHLPTARASDLTQGITPGMRQEYPLLAQLIDHGAGTIFAASGSLPLGGLFLDARHLSETPPITLHGHTLSAVPNYTPFFVEDSLLMAPHNDWPASEKRDTPARP